ncbi:GNAT family N-acetyltransferase [Streptomyces lunaelactis]|uniref:GNAT family N-acetyltransferase n=1 Tax=Streptomyces lunaelactis TaxID=1535768 RepID=A0A2R4T1K2_9ACTN|nr:GNAT family N-acetyltransferase [Streptomyces lunaelactis]AVZ73010.1 GNAT family N-acetyltransferase [Streptomyces lunaelactis]NUK83471.1 GNAT family N-acetyltransferase [Streptomyces lunaelactis]
MPQLIAPDVRFHASFLGAMKEFLDEGSDPNAVLAHEVEEFGGSWQEPDVFAAYVARQHAESLEDGPRPEGWVPNTNLWYVDGDTYLGRLAIRHRLTPFLLELGGHVGYAVRPSARRRGHAGAMLRDSLPYARRLGIDSVLVTCDIDNHASRRVIEANGGVLEDERGLRRRYWIRTGL